MKYSMKFNRYLDPYVLSLFLVGAGYEIVIYHHSKDGTEFVCYADKPFEKEHIKCFCERMRLKKLERLK